MVDFANGFYACKIWEEDQPYICFYVEGCRYFKYLCMPFGLTGAPSMFGEMTAKTLGDLVGMLFELMGQWQEIILMCSWGILGCC